MKIVKTLLKTLLLIAVIGGIGFGAYKWYQGRRTSDASTATRTFYQPVMVTTGSLTQSVTGTGSLTISETQDVTVPFPATITRVLVKEGMAVKVGDPVAEVDMNALRESIVTLTTEITDLDSSIASLADSYTGESIIKSTASGRVKQLFVKEGDMTNTVMTEYGGLMVISGDGKMKVRLTAEGLTLNEKVTVMHDGRKYSGIVASLENGEAVVTFPDTKALPGDEVTVINAAKVTVGSGRAEINSPYTVSSTVDGYVSAVKVKVNSAVSRNAKMVYVSHIPADTQYDIYTRQRQDKLAALARARETLVAGCLTSTINGIVSTTAAKGDVLEAGGVAATVYVGDAMQMTISVDELDIIHVAVGQHVDVAMDAMEDKTYDATVSYISQIGTPSSGVTNYSVTLDVQSDENLKIGMNGTATIVVNQVDDALLIPLAAVSTGRKGSYVWRYAGSTEGSDASGAAGEQVYITTGLSNADYVQVLSGLNEGDVVLLTRAAAGDEDAGGFSMPNMMNSFGGGMNMPGMQNNRNQNQNRNQNRQPGAGR